MKSAFELAMERLGGTTRTLTPEQKEQLAEVDRIFDAKVAQAKFDLARRQKEAADFQQQQQAQDDFQVEMRSLEERREIKKNELRKQFSE